MRVMVFVWTVLGSVAFAFGVEGYPLSGEVTADAGKKAAPPSASTQKAPKARATPRKESSRRTGSIEEAPPKVLRVFRLLHSSPKAVADALEGAFGSHRWQRGAPLIVIDARSGALIVKASEAVLDNMESLIATLDVAPEETPGYAETPASLRTKFRMEVYRLTLPRASFAKFDPQAISVANESAAGFAGALAEAGETDALYRLDQWVDFPKTTKISLGSRVPFFQGPTWDAEAKEKHSTVEYKSVDCRLELAVKWNGSIARHGLAELCIKLTDPLSNDERWNKSKAVTSFGVYDQRYAGTIHAGKPTVLLAVDGNANKETVTAYVTRFVFDRVE